MSNLKAKKTTINTKSLSAYLSIACLFWSSLVSAECDITQGKKQFNKCAACHSVEVDVHKMGPSLFQVMGREVGTLPDFYYSEAMQKSDFIWSEKTLSAFLESPMTYVKGTTMPFSGIKKIEQRDALICYLQQFK